MSRVLFDDDEDGGLSSTKIRRLPPQESAHWQSLNHQPDDELVQNRQELVDRFRTDLDKIKYDNAHSWGDPLALWSCVAGYAEALATHKRQRHAIFPLPWTALQRLVYEEFQTKIESISVPSPDKTPNESKDTIHRQTVKAIADEVWAHTLTKPNTRDEWHANSIYVWLRGKQIDKKSLDCFGAALTIIAACHCRGLTSSRLTLSEDHAYESHILSTGDNHSRGTCEVAVPGNTKEAKAKRGREIAETFSEPKKLLTPQTSWLYMAANPVICDSLGMSLVAVMGNINCTIEKQQLHGTKTLASGQLFDLKRDLLWVLHDHGYMSKFPFGLLELGDCEEHRGSPRSEEWVQVDEISEPILVNEKLFVDAIRINKEVYHESQVYPYFYAGHYHKDAGNEGAEDEYRLVYALKSYAEAARVASGYRYEGADSLQLNKHMTSLALLISEDILRPKYRAENAKDSSPRQWVHPVNALAATSWLIGFLDSLLVWEEQSNGSKFVEILSPTHKYGIGKLFQLLDHSTRVEAMKRIMADGQTRETRASEQKEEEALTPPFCYKKPRSNRLSPGTLLFQALQKLKVTIREGELAILTPKDDNNGRRSKRARR